MAVTSVNELWDGREGRETFDASSGFEVQYNRVLVAVTDDPTDDQATVFASSSVPNLGDTHPSNTNAVCVFVDAINHPLTRTVWTVTADYTTNPGAIDFGEAPNPIQQAPRISLAGLSERELIYFDVEGERIKNSAGDPLPPLERLRDLAMIRIIRNELQRNLTVLTQYLQRVNSDTFLNFFPARTVRLSNLLIDEEQISSSGLLYYPHTYEFVFDPRGWREPVPDLGFNAKKPDIDVNNQTKRKVANTDGQPVALDGGGFVEGTASGFGGTEKTNVLLQGGGLPIVEGDPLDGVKKYQEVPFAPLGF